MSIYVSMYLHLSECMLKSCIIGNKTKSQMNMKKQESSQIRKDLPFPLLLTIFLL